MPSGDVRSRSEPNATKIMMQSSNQSRGFRRSFFMLCIIVDCLGSKNSKRRRENYQGEPAGCSQDCERRNRCKASLPLANYLWECSSLILRAFELSQAWRPVVRQRFLSRPSNRGSLQLDVLK